MRKMKYLSMLFCVLGLAITTNCQAQFKLKKLDNVVLSLGENQTLNDYNEYLTKYFSRIERLESLSEKGNYSLDKNNNKSYLQGTGINENQQKVIFRIEVEISDDGKTITKSERTFKVHACVARSCASCKFEDELKCVCEEEGECESIVE